MSQIAFEQGPDPRDIVEIARLAVALPQPHENADDLGVALRPEPGVVAEKFGSFAGLADIVIEHLRFELGGHVAPRVLQQRDQVVGLVSGQRVLEIEQALLLKTAQQHDVFGVIIAQHANPDTLPGEQLAQRLLPRPDITLGIDLEALRGAVPFGEQPGFALVLSQRVIEKGARGQLVQFDQCIDRGGIDRALVAGPLVEVFAHPHVAEVLDQDQPARGILGVNVRGAQAVGVKPFGCAQVWRGVLVGRRRIHQHRGFRPELDPEIAPE